MAADTTQWIPAYKARIKFGANYLKCSTASLGATLGEFDTDNSEGGVYHEFGIDKLTTQLTCTVVVSVENIATIPKIGASAVAEWQETPTGGVTHSGTGRITSLTKKGGGKGGYTFDLTIKFSGEVTNLADASLLPEEEE